MTRPSDAADQIELFAAEPKLPGGFAYGDDVITAAEEAVLAEQIAELPFKPFEFRGYLGNRRVVSFGFRYDYSARVLQAAAPLPDFLLPLRDRAAAFAGIEPANIVHALINEYAPGAGIGWHRDKPDFADVIAVSLLAPCTLRLRREDGAGWQRTTQRVLPRSAYLLRGPVRHDWQHSIPALDELRYSVTFRTLADKAGTRRAVSR
jgi:alkylated DNA repair dioxygenase AlkB